MFTSKKSSKVIPVTIHVQSRLNDNHNRRSCLGLNFFNSPKSKDITLKEKTKIDLKYSNLFIDVNSTPLVISSDKIKLPDIEGLVKSTQKINEIKSFNFSKIQKREYLMPDITEMKQNTDKIKIQFLSKIENDIKEIFNDNSQYAITSKELYSKLFYDLMEVIDNNHKIINGNSI